MWKIMNVEKNISVQLTESLAMYPAASVSGLYFAHPKSFYFSTGKILKDQVSFLLLIKINLLKLLAIQIFNFMRVIYGRWFHKNLFVSLG